jgi:hypothetical protein
MRLKFNGSHQFMIHTDDVQLLGQHKCHKEDIEVIIDAIK